MEATTVPQRPWKVTLAVNLLYLGLVIGEIQGFLEWPLGRGSLGLPQWGPWSWILRDLTHLLLLFGLYYMIGKGRNWARMIFLTLSVIGAILIASFFYVLVFTEIPISQLDPQGLLATYTFSPTLRSIALSILQIFSESFYIAALILLFQRDSSDWFKAMKAQRLVEEGSEIRPKEVDPEEALIAAARTGNMKQVRDLLQKGTNVNARNEWGLTPLMGAAQNGHAQAGKLLLEKGAEINARQDSGWTTLMVASFKGHADFVNILLGKGADVSARTEKGVTALMLASSAGAMKIAELLKAHGAKE